MENVGTFPPAVACDAEQVASQQLEKHDVEGNEERTLQTEIQKLSAAILTRKSKYGKKNQASPVPSSYSSVEKRRREVIQTHRSPRASASPVTSKATPPQHKLDLARLEIALEQANRRYMALEEKYNDEVSRLGRTCSQQRLRIRKLDAENKELEKKLQASQSLQGDVTTAEANILHVVRKAVQHKRTLYGHTIEHTRGLFQSMDIDNSGFLSRSEISEGFHRLGLGLTQEQNQELMCHMYFHENKDHHHGISYEEFAKALHGHRKFVWGDDYRPSTTIYSTPDAAKKNVWGDEKSKIGVRVIDNPADSSAATKYMIYRNTPPSSLSPAKATVSLTASSLEEVRFSSQHALV